MNLIKMCMIQPVVKLVLANNVEEKCTKQQFSFILCYIYYIAQLFMIKPMFNPKLFHHE